MRGETSQSYLTMWAKGASEALAEALGLDEYREARERAGGILTILYKAVNRPGDTLSLTIVRYFDSVSFLRAEASTRLSFTLKR